MFTRGYITWIGLGLGLINYWMRHVIELFFQFQHGKCKIKNCKGFPPQKRSHMGKSLGVRASWQNINQTNHNSTIQYPVVIIPSIQSWKTQNENLQGIPHQTGSDTGISFEYRVWTWAWSPPLGCIPIHFNKDSICLMPIHFKHPGDSIHNSWLRLAIATPSST